MLYHIDSTQRSAGGRTGTVFTLRDAAGSAVAEVWPDHGFNALRWQSGGVGDLLYASPEWEQNPVPTRSGVPLLFPFPNRIRDGRFEHEGREYQLPLNDSTKKNAIHGFAPRRPWHVAGHGADASSAWIRGEFRASREAPDTLNLWPSDYTVAVTIRLRSNSLRYEFQVSNDGHQSFPFGLGMHPYFCFPHSEFEPEIQRCRLHAPARSIWELADSLPTGGRKPATGVLDWNIPRLIGDTTLDTLYTDLGTVHHNSAGLCLRAELRHADRGGSLQVWASPDFRESVLFTPVHRQAICIEPYTCATDAANLSRRGIDAGWRVLATGESWQGIVEFRWDGEATETIRAR
jgi:aldose 1-epimerase